MIARTCKAPKKDRTPGECGIPFEQEDHAWTGSGRERKYCSQRCTQNGYEMNRFGPEYVRRASTVELLDELHSRGIYLTTDAIQAASNEQLLDELTGRPLTPADISYMWLTVNEAWDAEKAARRDVSTLTFPVTVTVERGGAGSSFGDA